MIGPGPWPEEFADILNHRRAADVRGKGLNFYEAFMSLSGGGKRFGPWRWKEYGFDFLVAGEPGYVFVLTRLGTSLRPPVGRPICRGGISAPWLISVPRQLPVWGKSARSHGTTRAAALGRWSKPLRGNWWQDVE